MTTWPNPDKPGFPTHPEQDGWVVLRTDDMRPDRAWWWSAKDGFYRSGMTTLSPEDAVSLKRIFGERLVTPADHAASVAAAAEGVREAIANERRHLDVDDDVAAHNGSYQGSVIVSVQRELLNRIEAALPIPSADALARRDAEKVREGRLSVVHFLVDKTHQASYVATINDLLAIMDALGESHDVRWDGSGRYVRARAVGEERQG